ncbi:hypothetical protein [Terasakiella sp.]|uniref:hypothetical protein n=1 Tax=Terasakiella sp. TaxID=2034861 RepID=UPI003B004C75
MGGFEIFMLISTILSSTMSIAQAQSQKKAQQKAAQQAADQAAKDQWEAYEKAEKKRKEDLRKALAQKRARMGASGFSPVDGSAGAIVQGMRNDTAEAIFEDYETSKELDRTISGIQSNLLQSSKSANRQIMNEIGGMATSIGGTMLKGIDQKKPEIDYTKEQPGQLYEF